MASEDVATQKRPTQEEELNRWLVSRFRDLGFPPSLAEDLVAAKVNWRDAEKVLDKGPPGGIPWAFYYLMPDA